MVPEQLRLARAGSIALTFALALVGLAVWRVLPVAFGRPEPYDDDDTWTVMIVLAAVAGLAAPWHAWRWGLALASLQVTDAALDITHIGGPYVWRALAFFAIYAILLALVAEVTATLRTAFQVARRHSG